MIISATGGFIEFFPIHNLTSTGVMIGAAKGSGSIGIAIRGSKKSSHTYWSLKYLSLTAKNLPYISLKLFLIWSRFPAFCNRPLEEKL